MKPPRQKLVREIVIAAILVALIVLVSPFMGMILSTVFVAGIVFLNILYHSRFELFPVALIATIFCYFQPTKGKLILLLIMLLLSPGFFVVYCIYRFALGGLLDHYFQSFFYLFAGWIFALPLWLVTLLNMPVMTGLGLVIVFVLTAALHQLMVRVFARNGKTWQFRQSVAVAGIFCSFVIMAFAMKAAMQNGDAIARPQEDLTERWSMGKRIDDRGHPLDDQPKQYPPRR